MVAVIIAAALALSGQTPASPAQNEADSLVRQLKDFQPFERVQAPPDQLEFQIDYLFRQILQLGDSALPAMSRGLRDPDVHLRQNVAWLFFLAGMGHIRKLSGPWTLSRPFPR
jgi:hypothetical protein